MNPDFLNEMIARAMGDSQIERLVVIGKDGTLVTNFPSGNVETREQAQQWITDLTPHTRSNVSEWKIVPEAAWPDYLNHTQHTARFIDWGIKHANQDELLAMHNAVGGMQPFQLTLASHLLQIGVLSTEGMTSDLECDAIDETEAVALDLMDDLMRTYGALLSSKQLMHALGFRTEASLSRSIREGHFTAPMFKLPGRPGRFATALDVAIWIAAQRGTSTSQNVALARPSLDTDAKARAR